MMLSNDPMRTAICGTLNVKDLDREVLLCGWVDKNRDLGSLRFIDLRDRMGIVQLNFKNFLDDMSLVKQCYCESVIQVLGTVSRRPANAKNKDRKTGEIEVLVEKLKILSRCDIENLPFLPTKKDGATEELKLKFRYLALRNSVLQQTLKTRSEVMRKVRNFFYLEEFTEVETPLLSRSTPEGARDYLVPSRTQPHHVYALPQSPQILKQFLMIGGVDKYFQICRCFRDEDFRGDRQPEFTQIDVEASFVDAHYFKRLSEKIISLIFNLKEDFSFTTMSYREAMAIYGTDKPDTRFNLKHQTCTSLFKESSFKPFLEIESQDHGLIKALFFPKELGNLSRKDIEHLEKIVKPYQCDIFTYFKVTQSQRTGGISKFIDDALYSQLLEGRDERYEYLDGTWLFMAGRDTRVHASGDALRRYLGKRFDLYREGFSFLWIYDFPLFYWSEESQRLIASHHPFTSPKLKDKERFKNSDPIKDRIFLETLKAESFDIVCNGQEIAGGSSRIYEEDVQTKIFEIIGMDGGSIQKEFGFFLQAFKCGVPPHGGIAFGLERIMMLLLNKKSIREVMAFPKANSGNDPMTGTPSVPDEKQLRELHFKWDRSP